MMALTLRYLANHLAVLVFTPTIFSPVTTVVHSTQTAEDQNHSPVCEPKCRDLHAEGRVLFKLCCIASACKSIEWYSHLHKENPPAAVVYDCDIWSSSSGDKFLKIGTEQLRRQAHVFYHMYGLVGGNVGSDYIDNPVVACLVNRLLAGAAIQQVTHSFCGVVAQTATAVALIGVVQCHETVALQQLQSAPHHKTDHAVL